MIKTVVGSFDSVSEAASAARDLRAAGFLESDVNVVANNAQRPFGKPVADGVLGVDALVRLEAG